MFYIIAVRKSLLIIFVKNFLVIPCLHREQTCIYVEWQFRDELFLSEIYELVGIDYWRRTRKIWIKMN